MSAAASRSSSPPARWQAGRREYTRLTTTQDSAIMRVLLAGDQDGLRSALRLVLAQEPGMELVGEVTDMTALVDELAALQPDLVLLDWDLPELLEPGAGRRLLATLLQRHPYLRVIVLSGRPEKSRSALAAGASLFVSKVEPPERLLAALHAVADNR